jgi:hypothetical protein
MLDMRRGLKQKVIAGAAAAALFAGGSVAAVSATGQSSPRKHSRAGGLGQRLGVGQHRGHVRDLATAATYLGISPARLSSELGSAKTLAQIADATPGKSAAGLAEALVAARRARLASATAKLPQRVAAEISRAGGPAGATGRAARHRAGRVRQVRLAKRLATLRKRVSALEQRQRMAAGSP